MLLGIAAELSAPPSEPMTFRTVTLYAKVFRHYDVVVISEEQLIDLYWRWMLQRGLMDFVDQIVTPQEILSSAFAVEIAGGPGASLTAHNLAQVVALL